MRSWAYLAGARDETCPYVIGKKEEGIVDLKKRQEMKCGDKFRYEAMERARAGEKRLGSADKVPFTARSLANSFSM